MISLCVCVQYINGMASENRGSESGGRSLDSWLDRQCHSNLHTNDIHIQPEMSLLTGIKTTIDMQMQLGLRIYSNKIRVAFAGWADKEGREDKPTQIGDTRQLLYSLVVLCPEQRSVAVFVISAKSRNTSRVSYRRLLLQSMNCCSDSRFLSSLRSDLQCDVRKLS